MPLFGGGGQVNTESFYDQDREQGKWLDNCKGAVDKDRYEKNFSFSF